MSCSIVPDWDAIPARNNGARAGAPDTTVRFAILPGYA